MKILFRILLLNFVWSISVVNAQGVKIPSGFGYPEYNVRTGVFSWADYDAGLMLGAGVRWSDRFSAAIEPTWIFYKGIGDNWPED